jgi:hypothetical protein
LRQAWKLIFGGALLLLASPASAVFLEYGNPTYDALKDAAMRSGDKDWVFDRLAKNQPLTEMVAKEKAKALLNSSLEPQYKKALRDAFPSETQPTNEKYVLLEGPLKALADQVSAVTARLDRFEAGMRNGLLSGRSRPSLLGSLNADMFSEENWHGPGNYHKGPGVSAGGSGVWTEWTMGGDGYNLTWVMEFYLGYIDFTQAHLGFFFDNAVLPGIEVVVADENTYPALSTLIFSGGGGGMDDPFHDITSLAGRKDLVKSGPGFGARGGQDIYLRRKGSGDWWPFSDTQLVATQTYSYFGQYDNDLAGNVKIRGLPLFWPFERTEPAFTFLWNFIDQADINTWLLSATPPPDVTANSSAQSLAFNSLLAGGGSLYFEFAEAEWEQSDVGKDYRDFAVLTSVSKSFGRTAFVFDFQHTGPDYFPGTDSDPSGNDASSFISDPRPGKNKGAPAWKTVAQDPENPTSGTEHLALGASSDFESFSVGITLGTNQQIQPSGPWVDTRHLVGWPWDQGKEKKGWHGFGQVVPQSQYQDSVLTDVYYQGVSMGAHAAELSDRNKEQILLTHGVGNYQLLEDSVKYVNFVDLRGDINFQSLFNLKKPCLLKYSSSLRNVQESFAIPAYGDQSLLMQMASTLILNAEFPGNLQVVTGVGYEDWLSTASFRPIEYHTKYLIFEFYKDFPEFLSGFSVGPRLVAMEHQDPHNGFKNFTAWTLSMGAGTSF